MRVGIVGGGSIGLLIAYYLTQNGNEVTVYVHREIQKNKLNKDGLYILPYGKQVRVESLLLSELKEEDLMIVCVKLYHLEHIWGAIKNISCPLIFIQNGMGHVGALETLRVNKDVVVATIEHGAKRIEDNVVKHNGKGIIKFALFCGNVNILRLIGNDLSSPSFPFKIENDWYDMLAQKLVVNAVINPITALFQVKNGDIITNPYLHNLCKALCQEAVTVLGLDPVKLWDKVLTVAYNTTDNDSSMKLDILNNRKTEIDGISGYLITKAVNDIPYTSFVYASIKAIEYNNQ